MRYISRLQSVGVLNRTGKTASTQLVTAVSNDPNAPEPLDRDLPKAPALVGQRGRRLLWIIGLLALVLRIILIPIGHPWDLTTDYNMFIDLAHNRSSYDTFTYLAHIAQSANWGEAYEYYAYPPIPLYLYYPLAKLFILFHPQANYFFPVMYTYGSPSLPLDFFVLFKLPIWIADFLIAALLARMTGTIRGARDYLLNPYVLLVSGAWTFDAIMVLGLVAAVYALYKHKFAYSGIALAFGTMVKFFPAIAVPTIVMYMIKKNRPLRDIIVFLVSYAVACLVFLGPFAGGVISVLSFHGSRVGGGVNWQYILTTWALLPPSAHLDQKLAAIAVFGTPMMIVIMLLVYWYIWWKDMSLNRMMVVTLLGFFVSSKLINEQYALMLLPFAYIEARRLKGVWSWFYHLFWIVPFAFACFHVPIDRFFWLFFHTMFKQRADFINITGQTGFEWTMVPWQHPKIIQIICTLLGFFFTALTAVALLWPVKSRPLYRLPSSEYNDGSEPEKSLDHIESDVHLSSLNG